MPRPPHIDFPGALYHVFSRGVDGRPVFLDDSDFRHFIRLLRDTVTDRLWLIHAFCLMTNHFHILAETPRGGLSAILRDLIGSYSSDFNHRWRRHGHLWQARCNRLLVEPGTHFLECSRYIHLNPVRAGVVSRPEEYPWSSYRRFTRNPREFEWVTTDRTMAHFAGPSEYAAFVLDGLQRKEVDPFRHCHAGFFFGTLEFAKQMAMRMPGGGKDLLLMLDGGMDPEVVTAAVDEACQGWSEFAKERITAYALQRWAKLPLREISAKVGKTRSAISHIRRSVEESDDSRVRRVVEELERRLGKRRVSGLEN